MGFRGGIDGMGEGVTMTVLLAWNECWSSGLHSLLELNLLGPLSSCTAMQLDKSEYNPMYPN